MCTETAVPDSARDSRIEAWLEPAATTLSSKLSGRSPLQK